MTTPSSERENEKWLSQLLYPRQQKDLRPHYVPRTDTVTGDNFQHIVMRMAAKDAEIERLKKEQAEVIEVVEQIKIQTVGDINCGWDVVVSQFQGLLSRLFAAEKVVEAERESSCCYDWEMRHDCGRKELDAALEAYDKLKEDSK